MTGLLDPKVLDTLDATWDDLSEVSIKSITFRGKTVKYRDGLPLDELAKIQAKYPGAAARTQALDLYVDILTAVLVSPAVESEAHKRALRKADGGFLQQIANDVLHVVPQPDSPVAETAKN